MMCEPSRPEPPSFAKKTVANWCECLSHLLQKEIEAKRLISLLSIELALIHSLGVINNLMDVKTRFQILYEHIHVSFKSSKT